MTFAPNMRIILRRSIENGSAMQMTHGYPLCAHTIATAMPNNEKKKKKKKKKKKNHFRAFI